MSNVGIDENILVQITELKEQLKIANTQGSLPASEPEKEKKRKEGSYELLKNGKARLYYMLKGERYRTTVDAKNDEEAEKQLALFVDSVKKGNFINTNYTFSEFTQIWLDNKVRPNSDEHKCVKKYISYLNNRVLPFLGNMKLKDITRQKLISYFDMLKETKTMYKNRKENKKIKPQTVLKIKSIIHACLEYAVELELLPKNPCDNITINFTAKADIDTIKSIVKKKREKIHYLNQNDFKRACSLLEKEIIEFNSSTEISNEKKLREVGIRVLVLLDLKTGMRRSELFGLARNEEFNDLDLAAKEFDVNKSRHYAKGVGKYTKFAKNDSSIRRKSLPDSLIPYIQIYFNLLDELEYKEMYIFEHLSIDGTSSWWVNWLQKHNFKHITFHDIRHTHATILLFIGVDIKTISERLGHSDIQTTMNIYADVLIILDRKSVRKIDKL